MLISPSLNNLLISELSSFFNLSPDSTDNTPRRYLNQNFFDTISRLSTMYDRMFTELFDRYPNLQILMHCYDYFIPIDPTDQVNRNKTGWCGKQMINSKIGPQSERENLMRYIIDAFSESILGLIDKKFQNNVTLVDTRRLVARDEWYDELHPNNEGFQKIADVFIREIERIKSRRIMS